MIYTICKRQVSIRGGSWNLPASAKNVSFFQNLGTISFLAIRYVSGIAENKHSFMISYLINSCGFSRESALSVSKKLHFETSPQPDYVISFFKNHGFSLTQIRNIIRKWPKLLLCNPEKTILPKLQFFYSKGIKGSHLVRILSRNPDVLRRNLDSCIIPNFNSFKDFARCDDNQVFLTYKNSSDILSRDFRSLVAPHLAILKDYGVPESNSMTEIVIHPRTFAVNPDKFRRTVEEVKKLGFNPLKLSFLIAVQAFLQISKPTWERKFNVLKQWGWSDEDILSAFEKYPKFMMFSEHKITATISLFVNTMGWKSSYIMNYPYLLSYSLEKRIIPRCLVLQALLSKGLIEKFNVYSMLACTEEKFLKKFVTPYDDPYFLKLYEEKQGHSQ